MMADWDQIQTAVELCEEYADRLFDGDESFTQVTKWDDGDFRVMVWHGKGWLDSDTPAQVAERIVYKHFDGHVMYVEIERRPDRHQNLCRERKVLQTSIDF